MNEFELRDRNDLYQYGRKIGFVLGRSVMLDEEVSQRDARRIRNYLADHGIITRRVQHAGTIRFTDN